MSHFLIVGLGNIGDEYTETRHNIGFKIVEELAIRHNCTFALDRHAHKADFKYKGRQVTLLKPTTYMNLSGKAVSFWMQTLKIKPENVLVILDDLAIDYGAIRIRTKGSDGGHNGLKSIDSTLGNNLYPRLRFGIGSEFRKGQQVDYVLGKWSADEKKILTDRIMLAAEAVESFVFEGIGNAMTKYNKTK